MADIKFIDGLIVKAPNERAPDYVKCKLSIKRDDLIRWLEGQSGEWINADVKESRNGKWYAAVDDWKPDNQREAVPKHIQRAMDDGPHDEIPF